MEVTLNQAKELLSLPQNQRGIKEAQRHEARVRLHTEIATSEGGTLTGGFFDFVKGTIPTKKYAKFLNLFRLPTPTAVLCDEIFAAQEKVFDGRDKVERRELASDTITADYAQYWQTLGGNAAWQTVAIQTLKTAFNSIVVVDLPDEVIEGRPAPYYYMVSTDKLAAYSPAKDGFKWVAFWLKEDKTRLAFYTETHYYVFSSEGKLSTLNGVLVEAQHDLGRCPAYPFWHDSLNGDKFLKRVPLSVLLGELDHLLKDSIFYRHFKLYASYPVWSGFKTRCDYQEGGAYCDGGKMRSLETGDFMKSSRGDRLLDCPKCAKSDHAGPGTYYEVDPPSEDNNGADLRNPVQVTEVGVDGLQFNVDELQRESQKIYTSVVGTSNELIDDQAINEHQVKSLFESGTAALIKLKHNFEKTQTWLETTLAELRYGPGSVRNVSINLGTQFYLFSADAILAMYEQARAAALDHAVLDMLQDQYYQTKYRHNPEQLIRSKLISSIDPCRHVTAAQAKLLYTDQVLAFEDYAIKANFSSLLMAFERDNGPLTSFGLLLSYSERVAAIKEALAMYLPQPKEAEGDDDGQGDSSGSGGSSGGSNSSGSAAIKNVREAMEAYGIGVRSGSLTPQPDDEAAFRELLNLPAPGAAIAAKWAAQGGTRAPVTIANNANPTDGAGDQ
jgi:hypothetical protein